MMTPDMFPGVGFDDDPNRRYTTTAFMAYIKRVAGVDAWDLDVDADAESHWAPRWFSKTHEPGCAGIDSLSQDWGPVGFEGRMFKGFPWRVFNNPPFDAIEPRLVKVWELLQREMIREFIYVTVAMVLPANRCEQSWWQEHVEPFIEGHEQAGRFGRTLTMHSPPRRQAYGLPGNREAVGVNEAPWPSCVLVWR